jgi:hypothetical protein
MRPKTTMVLALMFVASLAAAQHCLKADIDKSTGYCTVPDRELTPGEMDASLACSPSHGHASGQRFRKRPRPCGVRIPYR